jgi:hypothetical protein
MKTQYIQSIQFGWLLNIIEFIENLFRPARPQTPPPAEEDKFAQLNDARETVREIEARTDNTPIGTVVKDDEPGILYGLPEVKAANAVVEKGMKVRFLSHSGKYMTAKVVGFDGGQLVLSRNGGPKFRRQIVGC